MADFLIQTKLQPPPLRQNLIARDHLVARLEAGKPRLTLLSAPAGFGKTTLAVQWSQKSTSPFAWVSLETDDDDPLVFITYLVTALRSVDERFSGCLPAHQWPEPNTSLIPLVAAIINQAAAVNRDFYLVLDDYQEIQSPKLHELLNYLLLHQPPQMHLVVLSRTDPTGLPLARLRARNELVELRSADLRFNSGETALFLEECMNLSLDPDEVAAIDSQVEGWAAGLQLVGLSIRRPVTLEKVKALASSEGQVGEYLLAEVLDRQPPEIRRFLLHTSILRHICGELAEALTGVRSGQAMLHRLEQANLFIFPLDDERHWYGYHPLFLQLLRDQLWTSRPGHEIASLYEQAGGWFADHGMIDDAIHHSLMGEHYELAADLIEEHYEDILWKRGEAIKLRNQFSAFPQDFLAKRPRLALLYASVLLLIGDFEHAERCLRLAEETNKKDRFSNGLRANLRSARAVLYRLTGDLNRSIELSKRTLSELPENRDHLRILVMFNLGVSQLKMGRLSTANRALIEAVRLAESNGNIVLHLFCLYWLAIIEFEWGHLQQALEICEEGLQLAESYGSSVQPFAALLRRGYAELLYEMNHLSAAAQQFRLCVEMGQRNNLPEITATGYAGAGRLALLNGNELEGRRQLQQARKLLIERSTPEEARRMTAMHVDVLLRHGDLAQAGRWVNFCGLSLNDHFNGADHFFQYCLLARYWIGYSRERKDRSRLPEVIAMLGRMAAIASKGESKSLLLRILILQSLAFDANEQFDHALSCLKQALSIGISGGFVRTFLDEGPAMADLLRCALQKGIEPAAVRMLVDQTFLGEHLAANRTLSGQVNSRDALTERESEVLMLIAAGLSNDEIAERLVVTVNTVRTHIKSINRKFGVRSRTQAVYQAQQMGLLSGG